MAGAAACLIPSRLIARISFVPASRLAPFLLAVLVLGAYQSTRSWGDLWAFLGLGLLGWAMKHLGWPRPPLLIGFVLALSAERYLWISWSRYGWEWLGRPGVLLIGIATLALTVAGARLRTSAAELGVPGEE